MTRPISLYFHIPFCSKKCPYCHFFVLKDHETAHRNFLDALKKEWEQKKDLLKDATISSIYFGGGTPSLLSVAEFNEIFSLFSFSLKDIEITLEANPENLKLETLNELKSLGINRISLGVQSFDDTLLKKIGREHDGQKAISVIEHIHKAGIENISIDLMYDLPDQTVTRFDTTLNIATSLPITHISLYNLTLEPKTPFFRKREELLKRIPKEEESFSMLEKAIHHFQDHQFYRYEISAFAKNEKKSHHNVGYWTARSFLGYGPSAFSYLENKRFSNVCNMKLYEKRINQSLSAVDFEEMLSPSAHFRELLAIRLRYFTPFSLREIDCDIPPDIFPLIQRLKTLGFLQEIDHKISLTEKGSYFYDTIAEEIIE